MNLAFLYYAPATGRREFRAYVVAPAGSLMMGGHLDARDLNDARHDATRLLLRQYPNYRTGKTRIHAIRVTQPGLDDLISIV